MLYKCEHCDYASNRKYNLKKHEKNIHEKFLHEAASYSAHCDYKSSNKKHCQCHLSVSGVTAAMCHELVFSFLHY